MRVDALIQDSAALQALRGALRQDVRIRSHCSLFLPLSWKELEARAKERAFDVALVQPSFPVERKVPPNGLRNIERLMDLLAPGSVIPFLAEADQKTTVLQALATPLFPFVLLQGIDDHPGSILRVLSRAENHRLLSSPLESIFSRGDVDSIGHALAALTGWPPAGSVKEVATRLGMSPRTLRRRLAKPGLRPPKRLIMWGQLLDAAALARLGIHSRARIASILGLAGPGALAQLARELTGKPLEEVFRPGGETSLLQAFLEDLAA